MSRPKKDSKEFTWIRIGGCLILSRLSKGIKHVDPAGNPSGWVRLGGLLLSGGKGIKATIGAFDVDSAKVTIEPNPTSDPLTSEWFLAGAKIGETYMSYDKQPKLSHGPMDAPVYIARIKRNDDFDTTVHYWKKWLEWRQAGAGEAFDVFVFGKRSISGGQSTWDTIYKIQSHIARVRALKQRMQAEYGLSLKQESAAELNPKTVSKSEAKTPKKKPMSRQTCPPPLDCRWVYAKSCQYADLMQNLMLTKRDVAKQCQVSMRTVDGWIRDRKIPTIHLSKRCVRFRADKVMEAFAKFERRAVA